MIQANELRIDNWVEANSPMMQVKEITDHTIGLYMPGSEADPFLYDVDEIHPIPLSPEILEKCGWGKSDEHEYGMNTINENNDGLYFDYHFKRFRMDFGENDNIKMPHIQSLHQLQNLYYALTGEELIYTP